MVRMKNYARCLLLFTTIAYLLAVTPTVGAYALPFGDEPEILAGDTRGLTNLYRTPSVYGSRNPTDEGVKYIALTFDDGPHKKYTSQILDILAKYGVKATFFVVGRNCEKYPELVARELDEGHEVGNHTYSHPDIGTLNEGELVREVLGTEDILQELRGYRPRIFRPPAGKYNVSVDRIIARLNYIAVLWNVDTHDWKCPPAALIAKEILNKVKPGYIILMHDYVVGTSGTPEALQIIIPKLLALDYCFVTVSELINLSGTPEE